jgi:hypothetical protein
MHYPLDWYSSDLAALFVQIEAPYFHLTIDTTTANADKPEARKAPGAISVPSGRGSGRASGVPPARSGLPRFGPPGRVSPPPAEQPAAAHTRSVVGHPRFSLAWHKYRDMG